jgi:Brp/Blh family beta-carotene 15,15'-monooxygenase
MRFLDEKTSLREDIKMFYHLPIFIFLGSFTMLVMRKANSILFLFSSVLIYFLLQRFVPQATETIMYSLLISGLILIGIPHGAMDHMTKVLHPSKQITISFILKYLGLMAIVYLLWLYSSDLALVSFLLYSAWHFGQTDTEEWKIESSIVGFIWGVLFFLSLFSAHVEEFQQVLMLLEVTTIDYTLDYTLIFAASMIISSCLALIFKKIQWFALIAFLFLSQWIPLVISFGLYFIFHHSYEGWSHLKQSSGKSNLALFKVSLPFNIGAFILFLIFFLNPKSSLEVNTSLFFVFISCISFPHIVCMHKFYKLRKNSGSN